LSVAGHSVVHVRQCRGCGSPLSKRSQKVYCGNACQASVRRDITTKRWLESGEAWVGTRRGHYIRHYLAEAQSGCCAICGGASTWLDLPLALVLDHIDGNPTNNWRENLRLICPNCDSQLVTYKGRNRGNGRHYRRQRYADGHSF
jgi:5-methylcytosine-specific restriction endonuclease McrA